MAPLCVREPSRRARSVPAPHAAPERIHVRTANESRGSAAICPLATCPSTSRIPWTVIADDNILASRSVALRARKQFLAQSCESR